jgi:hypothetical protein
MRFIFAVVMCPSLGANRPWHVIREPNSVNLELGAQVLIRTRRVEGYRSSGANAHRVWPWAHILPRVRSE